MSGLKREDEYRLKQLQQQAADDGRSNMPEDDQMLLLLLEDRYNRFLDEGLRKLREGSPKSPPRGSSFARLFSSVTRRDSSAGGAGSAATPTDAGTSSAGRSGGSSPAGNPTASVSSASSTLASATPLQAPGKHWTWVLDNLIVGAIPYAAPTPDTPGHLCELVEQCFQRKSHLAVVVSCMEIDEATPQGFAVTKDWETFLNVNTFLHCAVIPNGVQGVAGGPMTWTNMSFMQAATPAAGAASLRSSAAGVNSLMESEAPFDDSEGSGSARPAASVTATVDGNGNAGEPAGVASAATSPGQAAAAGAASDPPPPYPSQRVETFESMLQLCQQLSKLLRANGESNSSNCSSPTAAAATAPKSRLGFGSKRDTSDKQKVAFIHCKAGACRAWVFTMCFLLCQLQRPYEECEAYLKSLRTFYPKQVQIDFVRQFATYIEQPREPDMSADDEKYFRILADVLSLPQRYRVKLIKDLEKLT